jgi:large subunit ribosomal protein L33
LTERGQRVVMSGGGIPRLHRARHGDLQRRPTMAKKKAMAREYVWLQCTETGDLNYRTSINVKGGIQEKLKEGFQKYSPRLRKHTLHKIKRK